MSNIEQTYIIVTAIGADSAGILEQIAQFCHQCNCNIHESRVTSLGQEFASYMLLSGAWSGVAKLEAGLDKLGSKLSIAINSRRTLPPVVTKPTIPYLIQVITCDRKGIVRDICRFLKRYAINISDCSTETYMAPKSQHKLFSLTMAVQVPSTVNVPQLREQFAVYCEEKNLDAVIEPYKAS
jgi:glycine cleavage system transcriptional repressor